MTDQFYIIGISISINEKSFIHTRGGGVQLVHSLTHWITFLLHGYQKFDLCTLMKEIMLKTNNSCVKWCFAPLNCLFIEYVHLNKRFSRVLFNTRSVFKAEFNRFEFRVFLLQGRLFYHVLKSSVCTTILPIACGRTIGCTPFPSVFVPC